MQLYKVGANGKIPIPHDPILYRWWFPDDSKVLKSIRTYSETDTKMAELLKKVEMREIDGQNYHALYFGKSNDGYRRFAHHSTGNIRNSTLRLTIYGLCIGKQYDEAKEELITQILKECYYEWLPFTDEGKLVECIEGICIAIGNYPLNIDGNPAISDHWRKHLMNARNIK